jgi:hypothetical protein
MISHCRSSSDRHLVGELFGIPVLCWRKVGGDAMRPLSLARKDVLLSMGNQLIKGTPSVEGTPTWRRIQMWNEGILENFLFLAKKN